MTVGCEREVLPRVLSTKFRVESDLGLGLDLTEVSWDEEEETRLILRTVLPRLDACMLRTCVPWPLTADTTTP